MKYPRLIVMLLWSSYVMGQVPTVNEVGAKRMPPNIVPVKAPFKMPVFRRPVFPSLTVNVTSNIQSAIDEVSKRGGGTVNVPAGKWKTGRIILKSDVNLHLMAG